MLRWVSIAAGLLAAWLALRVDVIAPRDAAAPLPAPAARPDRPVAAVGAAATARAAARLAAARAPERPGSLADVATDGWLTLDPDRRFVADRHARRLFDHLLSSLGERSPREIRALVLAEARGRVPSHQVAAVMALFDDYLAYLEASVLAAERLGPDGDPSDGLRELERLQDARFGEASAEALFAGDRALAAAAVERRAIAADPALTVAQRQAALAAVERTLPASLRVLHARVRAPAQVSAQVEALRREGASADEIWSLRAERFGPAAADRLAALDRERRRRGAP